MPDNTFSPENGPQETHQENTGFQPESTEEIIDDLTPEPEKKPNSMLGFLRTNALRLAPLALLGAAVFGGEKIFSGSSSDSGQATSEITQQDQLLIENFQTGEGIVLKDLAKSPEAFANTYKNGEIVGRDEHGNPVETGFVDVRNYPANKLPNGANVEVIAKLPVGTKIENLAITSPQDKKDPAVNENYVSFACESVKGDFHDTQVVEKTIDLGNGTICVVPWVNVYGSSK